MFLRACRPGRNYMNSCVTRRRRRDSKRMSWQCMTLRKLPDVVSDQSDRSDKSDNTLLPFSAALQAGLLVVFFLIGLTQSAQAATARQKSLDEWRILTSPGTNAPRAFVRGDR